MKKIIYVSIISSLMLLSGCDNVLNKNDPVSVAQAFWVAALSDSRNEAKSFMVDSSKLDIGIKGRDSRDTASLGKVDQQDGYYFIETNLMLFREGNSIQIPMRTVVVPVDGLWKVDYWSTKQSIFDATFAASMSWFTATLDSATTLIDGSFGTAPNEDDIKYVEGKLKGELARLESSIMKKYKEAQQLKSAKAIIQPDS
jgi:hypothetical protein